MLYCLEHIFQPKNILFFDLHLNVMKPIYIYIIYTIYHLLKSNIKLDHLPSKKKCMRCGLFRLLKAILDDLNPRSFGCICILIVFTQLNQCVKITIKSVSFQLSIVSGMTCNVITYHKTQQIKIHLMF